MYVSGEVVMCFELQNGYCRSFLATVIYYAKEDFVEMFVF